LLNNLDIDAFNVNWYRENDGHRYKIWYKSSEVKGDFEGLTVIANDLTGGNEGTRP
jgi:hypothetical protein